MGLFSGITKAIGSVFGSGDSGGTQSTNTTSSTTVNPVTNVNVDLKPLSEVLAQSQSDLAKSTENAAKFTLASEVIAAQSEAKKTETIVDIFDQTKKGATYLLFGAALIYLITHTKKEAKK